MRDIDNCQKDVVIYFFLPVLCLHSIRKYLTRIPTKCEKAKEEGGREKRVEKGGSREVRGRKEEIGRKDIVDRFFHFRPWCHSIRAPHPHPYEMCGKGRKSD